MTGVTVIIPTYNRAATLPAAIESVMAQELADVEIIVADDGSTDGTQALLAQRYGEKIRAIPLPHSGLPAVARNAALREAMGEYVAFLDSDDRWLPGKLHRQLKVMAKNPLAGLVCCNALVERPGEPGAARRFFADRPAAGGKLLKELIQDNFVITSTVLVRRSALERAGLFGEDEKLRAMEDYDLWLRIAAVSEVAYIPEPCAVYRDDPGGIRSERTRVHHWEGTLLVFQRLRAHLAQSGGIPEDIRCAIVGRENEASAKLGEACGDCRRFHGAAGSVWRDFIRRLTGRR